LLRGAILYGRADFKFLSGYKEPPPTYFMTFGDDAIKKFRNLKAKKPAYTSIALPDSKHVIMRTGWDRDDLYLMFDCAPWGGGHTHWDHLQINVYAYGQLLLPDAGMGSYDDKPRRNYLLHTEAHNVVMIDNKEQPRKPKPNPTVETFITTANFDLAQGLLQNYAGAKQLRSVFFLKPDYWIMVDRLDEMKPQAKPKKHSVKQLFHFAPTLLTIDKAAKTVHSNYSRGNLLLDPAGTKGVKVVEKQGWIGFTRSYTPKAPYVEYQREGTFPMVMPMVLYPYPGRSTPPPITTKLLAVSSDGKALAATEAICVKVKHEKTGTDYFVLSWVKAKAMACEGISSDGLACCLRYNSEGELTSAFLAGGKKIADKNGIVVEADKVLKKCDVQYRRDTIVVEANAGASLKIRASGKSKAVVNGKETEISAGAKVVEIKVQER
ncbi:MAG: heparinase II/III-family protein, partial [Phycisphaerae bacterium]|nr:heparinase II/III-family protein [Phycisphaerae bacterium]